MVYVHAYGVSVGSVGLIVVGGWLRAGDTRDIARRVQAQRSVS